MESKDAALVAELDTLLASDAGSTTDDDDDDDDAIGLAGVLLEHGVCGELLPFSSFLLFGREVDDEPLFRFLELYG